uniref:Uncharacterized protein n=1 Tax=Leersia perrieri TaxID=77586 RepID=A0A0D9VVX3_9ORYZ
MSNADRRSQEFNDRVHDFIRVAKANKQNERGVMMEEYEEEDDVANKHPFSEYGPFDDMDAEEDVSSSNEATPYPN